MAAQGLLVLASWAIVANRLYYAVPENSPVGFKVGQFRATDPRAAAAGNSSAVQYSILPGLHSELFILDPGPNQTAELVTRQVLDYEKSRNYSIIIRAKSPTQTTDVEVDIQVIDVNDNPPLLPDFWIIVNFNKNSFPYDYIGRIPAVDADASDRLSYQILSGNNAQLLFLNESTGELKLSPSLNTNVPTRAIFDVSVSDGIHDATAKCQLITNLVTDAMLANSVTLRLEFLSEQDFLSSLLDKFLDGLSAIIPAPKEMIVVFSVTEDVDALNVSFSVRRPDERDVDSYFTAGHLQHRVYVGRESLSSETGIHVLPFDDNLCAREPCLNFEKCLSVMKFEKAADFIATSNVLFRPIHPSKTFACKCPHGFSGMHHKYECDFEINLCYSNPCLNGARCERREEGYVCVCPEGFHGKNCEIDITRDDCSSNLCKQPSTCSSQSGSGGGGGFRCSNCTFSEWSSAACELQTRSFTRGSYLAFPSLDRRNRFKISFKFATRLDNQLLLYNGRIDEKQDFISVEILDSRLLFSFSLGSGRHDVSVATPMGFLSDGSWHEVRITYFNRTIKVNLDDCDEGVGETRRIAGELFSCSNKTTIHLEQRCSDRMQSCFRFLDLTGPLLLGGLPPLNTRFPVSARSFAGCISHLTIDEQIRDMNDFVANNGTRAGCLEKRGFCHLFPCQNRGKCREGWGSYICDCPDDFTGQDCHQTVDVLKSFRGDGYVSFTPPLFPIQLNWVIQFNFKTFETYGLLLRINLGQNSRVTIDVTKGYLRYTYNTESVTLLETKVNDGKWHSVVANWMPNGIWISVDHGHHEVNRELSGDVNGLYISKVNVGGLDPDEESASLLAGNTTYTPNLVGCVHSVDVGNGREGWNGASNEKNAMKTCSFSDHCLSSPCPRNSRCVNEGLGKYSCICDSGYVGSACQLACELNVCAHGSTCIPWNNTRGYKCLCDEVHTGSYCEESISQVCPSSWWGSPVCGPCACDVDKGYDANCNKVTGACSCQANYYKPETSDTCFECDCYNIGSFSKQCDLTSGQCQCRSGVIGRRCDSCASPFAEVTLNGCEVIYEGCPRTYTDGIWWERTIFGEAAIQSCPHLSTGRAERACDEKSGWLEADLFDCLSQPFIDLDHQLQVIERQDGRLLPYPSDKLADQLLQAINQTKDLRGRDVDVSFRLMKHLIMNERNQSGLNLTHKKNRFFLPAIMEITSSLLDLKNEMIWNRIRKFSDDGPELFLQLFKQYLEVLIENREDTFTHPFEVSSENVIFGMDTISTDQLWAMQHLQYYVNLNKSDLTAAASPSLDFSLSSDAGVAVSVPKYDNYPPAKRFQDDVTRVVVPLRTTGVPAALQVIDQILAPSNSSSRRQSNRWTSVFGYAIFQTLGKLLPESFDYVTLKNRESFPTTANTPVIVTVIRPVNSTHFLEKANPKIHYRLRVLAPRGHSNPRCASWLIEHRKNGTGNSRTKGRWSAKGCELKGALPLSRQSSTFAHVNCSCDRIAPIAVLMDITAPQALFQETQEQNIISYICLTISCLTLLLTLIILSGIRGFSTNSNNIHRNIVFCLLMTNLLFLIALKFRDDLVQREFPCRMIAILLHFFHICIFSWMLVEGIHLHRMITEIRDINRGPMKFYYFLGYAVPSIIVGLSVGVKADQYGNYFFCWLSISEGIVWSMVGPIAVLSLMNVMIFALVLRASIQMKDAVSDFGNLKSLLCLSSLLLPFLALDWIFALLTVNEILDGFFASFAYYIMSLVTAIYVFIGYCLVNRIVRLNLKHTWCRMIGRDVSVEESLSVTRMTLASRNAHSSFASPFDMHRSPRSFGVTTSSTTSRSTTTKTSSGPEVKRYRKHRRHRKHRFKHSSISESNPSLSLASSHSSDQDEGNSVAPTQNEINSVIQQSLNSSSAQPLTSEQQPQQQSQSVLHRDVTGNAEQGISDYGIIGPKIINHESRPYTRSNIFAMGLGGSPETDAEPLYSVRHRVTQAEQRMQQQQQQSGQQAPQYLLSPPDADSVPDDTGLDDDNKQHDEVKNHSLQEDEAFDQNPGEQPEEADHQSSGTQ